MELNNKVGWLILCIILAAVFVVGATNKVFVDSDFNQKQLLNISNITFNNTMRSGNLTIKGDNLVGAADINATEFYMGGILITPGANVNKTYVDAQDVIINNSAKNWTQLQNYPSACPSYSSVTALNDTVTCTDSWLNNDGEVSTGAYQFQSLNTTNSLNVQGNITVNSTTMIMKNSSCYILINGTCITM